jgi:hypothetical protein
VASIAAVLAMGGVATPAYAKTAKATVTVDGDVTRPITLTTAELEALPQTTFTITEGAHQFTDTGVSVETLVLDASPAYPASLLNTKNELLRVTVTIKGVGGRAVTLALGELDPNFGNHPAYLALTEGAKAIAGGPELVVPEDRAPIRWLPDVAELTVGIATAPATNTNPALGSPVDVFYNGHETTLTRAMLARLPQETLTVMFFGPGGEQTHVETGPPLIDVLAVAGVPPTLDTWVAAVGSDNYTAVVTPAEQLVGGRPLELSLVEDGVVLAQPRLVTDGDIKGGRYVSDIVDIYAGTGPAN